MAKCELRLHLEEEREVYRPGDVVRGWVEVDTDEDVDCKALTVGLRWRTRGKGTEVGRVAVSEVPFRGRWRAGGVDRYAFELELPAGPYTYRGHHLDVVWELFARADLPWAFDPEAQRELALAPDPGAEPDWRTAVGDPTHLPPELQQELAGEAAPEPSSPMMLSKAQGLGCLLAVLVPVLLFLGWVVHRALASWRGEIPAREGLGWLLAGVVVVLFVGGGLFKVLRDVMAWGKVGQVTAVVEPRLVRAGESFRVKLTCRPRREAELVAATARLEAREHAVAGPDSNKRSWRKIVHEQETEVAMGRNLARGLPFQTEATVAIPPDVAPSFAAHHNRLTWTVTLRLRVAGWPDWVEERTLLVHP